MTDAPAALLARLAQLAAALPHAGAEQSFKMARGVLLTQRCLYGVDKARLPRAAALDLAARLNMPDDWRHLLGRRYDAANFIYLGFEQDGQRAVYKWYLEFPVDTGTSRQGQAAPMYAGLKWNALDGAPIAITDYLWRVQLPLAGLHASIEAACATPDSATVRCARELLNRAAARVAPERLVLLDVSEADALRRSFDLNLYAADLNVGAVADALRTAACAMDIAPQEFDALLARIAGQPLGHVAGGVDRSGRDFLTLYYEV